MQFIRISESRWQGGVPSRIQEAFLKFRTWINYSKHAGKRALVHTTLVLSRQDTKLGTLLYVRRWHDRAHKLRNNLVTETTKR